MWVGLCLCAIFPSSADFILLVLFYLFIYNPYYYDYSFHTSVVVRDARVDRLVIFLTVSAKGMIAIANRFVKETKLMKCSKCVALQKKTDTSQEWMLVGHHPPHQWLEKRPPEASDRSKVFPVTPSRCRHSYPTCPWFPPFFLLF